MLFVDFARCCDQLEGISGRLEMIDIISRELPGLSDEELPVFVRFVMGRIFPDWSPQKLGIGPNLLYEAVGYVAGVKKEAVIDRINRSGDVGRVAEEFLLKKSQVSLSHQDLELVEVYYKLIAISARGGATSQKEKLRTVKLLLGDATPLEGRYLSRIMLEELRIGVGEGSVREAIAKAFSVEPALVEHAMQAINDLGEVARLAKTGEAALRDVKITPFHPVKMMLAQQGSIAGMVEEHGEVAAEYKYDGSRFQFHRQGSRAKMYSRRLEDVTAALPDVMELLLASTGHDVILDGEVIAMKDNRPMPFQSVLRRFRRRHDIAEATEAIRMVPNVFDILYLDGETLIDLPFSERRKRLESAVTQFVAPQVVSDAPGVIEKTYNDALAAGHEGDHDQGPRLPLYPGPAGEELDQDQTRGGHARPCRDRG